MNVLQQVPLERGEILLVAWLTSAPPLHLCLSVITKPSSSLNSHLSISVETMAELALAIIPLGLKTCSGLVSYLSGLKDHDDAIARLKRLTESLEGSFRLLEGFLKSGQLNSSTSQAVAQALQCLANCENALKNLKEFGDKLSASKMPDSTVKDRAKGSYRKLASPLRQDQLTQLENTLESLCTPLNLAVQSLQLYVTTKVFNTLTNSCPERYKLRHQML